MKVLQINVVYAQGSTGHIVETLHKEYLKEGIDSYVLFGRGPKQADKRVIRGSYLWEAKLWRFIALFTGNIYGGVPFSTLRVKHLIKKLKPDVVHLHCINGNMVNIYSLMNWLKKKGIKTVLTHHAEFMFTGGCGFTMCDKWKSHCEHCPHKQEIFGKMSRDRSASNWKRHQKAFDGFNGLTNAYVSSWLQDRAKLSPILHNQKGAVVFNPIESLVFNSGVSAPLPASLAGKDYVFLPISKFAENNKGTSFIEPLAEGLATYGISLAVAGAPDEKPFKSKNIVNLGFISSPETMASLYRNAKCTVVISKVESFSMPIAESICCGTPVAGFQAGGPESICPVNVGIFVPQGAIGQLISAINRLREVRISTEQSQVFSPAAVAVQYEKFYR
jgi:putative colanic acid biosynthesis glycosyltransferase